MVVDPDNVMDIARDVEHTILDPSDILLNDEVAVVTGGGGGIGQGIALGLARFGCDVAVLDNVPERAASTERAIAALGVDAIHVRQYGLLEDWGCDPPSPQGARCNCTLTLV